MLLINFIEVIQFADISNIHLAEIRRNQLVFEWSIDSDTASCSSSLDYNIYSENCGECPATATDTQVLCDVSSFVSEERKVCNFTVQIQACPGHPVSSNVESVLIELSGKIFLL